MCHENKMGAAKNSTHIEQYKLSKDSGTAVEQGTVTRPLFMVESFVSTPLKVILSLHCLV